MTFFLGLLTGASLMLLVLFLGMALLYLLGATRVRPEEQAVYDFTKNVPPLQLIAGR